MESTGVGKSTLLGRRLPVKPEGTPLSGLAKRTLRIPTPAYDGGSASDRNLKTDVARIDDAAVLDKVATLPIERWSYKSERGVRHVGPMAQDFYAAFGVGEDGKHITSIDEDGVALAAIKALHAENAQLRAQARRARQEFRAVTHSQSVEIAALRAEMASVRAEIRSTR